MPLRLNAAVGPLRLTLASGKSPLPPAPVLTQMQIDREDIEPPFWLLPPQDYADGVAATMANSGDCDVEAYKYIGEMAESGTAVPEAIMFLSEEDNGYIDSMVLGMSPIFVSVK